MITDLVLLIWVLLFSVPLYWWTPSAWQSVRAIWLVIVSWALIWTLSPIIFLGLLFYLLVFGLFSLAHRAGLAIATLKRCAWFCFVPLVLVEHFPLGTVTSGLIGSSIQNTQLLFGFAFLGISYTAIRTFIMIRELLDSKPAKFAHVVLTLSFFGSFVAGPITGSSPFRQAAPTLSLADATMALARIGWGGAMFLVVQPFIESLDLPMLTGIEPNGVLAAWLGVLQKFLALYVDFSGYSDIAIGCGLLFGIRLPENFNWPLKARSVQEFWQRWHMSLGAFIGTYLFKPLVRHFGKPTLAIFLAFTFVGVWHQVTWPYFLWGVGHGAALAGTMILRKTIKTDSWPRVAHIVVGAGGWVFTLGYVSVLSSFATSASFGDAIALIARLFGFSS